MTITFPTNTKDIIDDIRNVIGRNTVWYTVLSDTECTAAGCGLDPVTETAINPFCPVCSGIGQVVVYSGHNILGHVTWGYSELLGWVSGGQMDNGECRVQIEYTPSNITIVDTTKWVDVDGKDMQVIKRILRGVQPLNRILVDLLEIKDI